MFTSPRALTSKQFSLIRLDPQILGGYSVRRGGGGGGGGGGLVVVGGVGVKGRTDSRESASLKSALSIQSSPSLSPFCHLRHLFAVTQNQLFVSRSYKGAGE